MKKTLRFLDPHEQACVGEYLQNLHQCYGVDIVVTVCVRCDSITEIKNGQGHHGVMHAMACEYCKLIGGAG